MHPTISHCQYVVRFALCLLEKLYLNAINDLYRVSTGPRVQLCHASRPPYLVHLTHNLSGLEGVFPRCI